MTRVLRFIDRRQGYTEETQAIRLAHQLEGAEAQPDDKMARIALHAAMGDIGIDNDQIMTHGNPDITAVFSGPVDGYKRMLKGEL